MNTTIRALYRGASHTLRRLRKVNLWTRPQEVPSALPVRWLPFSATVASNRERWQRYYRVQR